MGHFTTLVQRLRAYPFASPLELWKSAHLSRRAGVLVVLSPCGADDLNVVLTVRAEQLSYAGDAALPGGKADTVDESPLNVALRESNEEVGLEETKVEFLNCMPGYLSSQMIMVTPSLVWSPSPVNVRAVSSYEVTKVFEVPLSRFLSAEGHEYREGKMKNGKVARVSYFQWLAANKRVGDSVHDRVWGLTAQILVDCAKVAFQKVPEFEIKDGRSPAIWQPSQGAMTILSSLATNGTLSTPRHKRK